MTYHFALAGNPNSGKTSTFNQLTGAKQTVGNWPGVTVERKAGRLRKDRQVLIQDLPGIYSLSPYTPEELISRNYLSLKEISFLLNRSEDSIKTALYRGRKQLKKRMEEKNHDY